MKACWWDEVAIRATDFAGIVPASRGAHCRPLHPWLASLCCPRRAVGIGPRGLAASRGGRLAPEPRAETGIGQEGHHLEEVGPRGGGFEA